MQRGDSVEVKLDMGPDWKPAKYVRFLGTRNAHCRSLRSRPRAPRAVRMHLVELFDGSEREVEDGAIRPVAD